MWTFILCYDIKNTKLNDFVTVVLMTLNIAKISKTKAKKNLVKNKKLSLWMLFLFAVKYIHVYKYRHLISEQTKKYC